MKNSRQNSLKNAPKLLTPLQPSRLLAGIALIALAALAMPGCHEDSGPPITPTHPVALPPPGGFTSPPGKGASVGGLPGGGGDKGSSLNQQEAKSTGVGSKAH
jgi:hypothetical protein